jgi:indole-3-glycerol phosphate synthase
MKDILEEIVLERKKTVQQLKNILPVEAWEMMPLFEKECISLKQSLERNAGTGIIAEFKRASPSKGIINDNADVFDVVLDYELNGASAVSILTEPIFFRGNNDDILNVARSITIPILRKDFIIDSYQIFESKAIGADIILLIAACLSPKEVKTLATTAKQIGLEVLLELHDESELGHICREVDLVGVNNRNLKNFEVDLEHSVRMAEKIGSSFVKIAESGINDIKNIRYLEQYGFKGFLIGEHFMKQEDPGKAFKEFTYSL